jgi:predicted amidohydrolase YtcJ
MAEALASHPPKPGTTLSGFGFRDGLWPDAPTAALLDLHTSDTPTVLVSNDLHCCWLNSAALARYGVTSDDEGLVREDDAFAVSGALQDVPNDVLDDWVAEAAADAASRGVVGVVDFEMTDNLAAWGRRFADGFSSLRIDAGIYTEHLAAAIAAGRFTGEPLEPSGLLAVGPFKLLIDGSLNTRTALCAHEYPGLEGSEHSRGILTVSSDRLVELMGSAAAAKIVPAIHAIGDEANRIALDAFQTVGCGGRIEHAQLLRPDDLRRFAALGVAASVQPEQAMDDRDVTDRYWAGRTERAFVLRGLLDAGAKLLFGSDAPVAPLDPWITMAAAVGRGRDGREPWHPEQAVTFEEALRSSTRSTIAVGQRADLVVLEADPFAASAEDLRTMPVVGTLVGGRWTHNTLGV